MSASETIFVQIASYRDPQLVPTVIDCIAKATYPERLRFGICWQRDNTELIGAFTDDSRFKISAYHWTQSKGLCWARSITQSLYAGENYTLQIDSHMRFASNWDEELIAMLHQTDSPKPLLTAYPAPFQIEDDTKLEPIPHKNLVNFFTDNGRVSLRPDPIAQWELLQKPIRANFVAGGFFFTLGSHCQEYRYDPFMYFSEDEISLSVRSFTLGYDLFHPHRNVIWHQYSREKQPRHWDDHTLEQKKANHISAAWHERDQYARGRMSQLLQADGEDNLGPYGLGTVRTLEQYERYTGLDFKKRRIQGYTLLGKEPPVPFASDEAWESGYAVRHTVHIAWDPSQVPQADDYSFWYLGVEDNEGTLLHREDIKDDRLEEFIARGISEIDVTFFSSVKPHRWVLWPVSDSLGWLRSIDGFFDSKVEV